MSASHRFLVPNLAHKLVKQYQQHSKLRNIQHNYNATLRRLRKKAQEEKLRVIFYTNEPQKWSYDSLYREFENSPYFSPSIVVVPRFRTHAGWDKTRMSLEDQFQFYSDRGYRVEYGYINGEYLDIKTFSPDIFFYLQLAEVPGIDDPYIVSSYALTFYCPYSYQLSDYRRQYLQEFHRLLFTNYMEHPLTLARFEGYKKGNSKNCVAVGYPKLDIYLKPPSSNIDLTKYWRHPDKFRIIYAPHPSFHLQDNNFRWGTFHQNHEFILTLAKNNPETTWIFKPHPGLKSMILKYKFMSEEEVNRYYDEWASIGNVYDSGDYFDIFKSSDLMITDCGSFLAEYLPSQKPLIRLNRLDALPLNELGEKFSECYYNAFNNDELLAYFEEIVIKKNDFLKERRIAAAKYLIDDTETSSHKIYTDISNRLKIKLS